MNSSLKAFCNISSIVAAIVCLLSLSEVYAYVSLLPVAFFVFLVLVNSSKSIWRYRPITLYLISILLWIRMVFLPLYGTLVGAFSTSSASMELSQHFIGSVFLCIYDCVVITIVLFRFHSSIVGLIIYSFQRNIIIKY